jgi:cytochrome P450
MPYLDLVNKESMRIMTTAASLQRHTAQTHTLSNGITIPKNTEVFFQLWGLHHSSAFSKPGEFNPDRFSDAHGEESRNWQPFLTGPRSCKSISKVYNSILIIISRYRDVIFINGTKSNSCYATSKVRIFHC